MPATKSKKPDLVGLIMAWESGEMSPDATVEFFGQLVKNGMAWTLQGCYGRMAARLIEAGYLAKTGKVLRLPSDGE